mmetsp:Transcript_19449/g.46444  ORF Transcript_19449/g.46444 Transcript_19449/m.46444 type:complete len:138 (+) Transcript_19449:259-672(+)
MGMKAQLSSTPPCWPRVDRVQEQCGSPNSTSSGEGDSGMAGTIDIIRLATALEDSSLDVDEGLLWTGPLLCDSTGSPIIREDTGDTSDASSDGLPSTQRFITTLEPDSTTRSSSLAAHETNPTSLQLPVDDKDPSAH